MEGGEGKGYWRTKKKEREEVSDILHFIMNKFIYLYKHKYLYNNCIITYYYTTYYTFIISV